MKLPTLPQWLTVAGAAFASAFVGSLVRTGDMTAMFTSWAGARPAIATAVMAGTGAVAALYHTAPQDKVAVEAAK